MHQGFIFYPLPEAQEFDTGVNARFARQLEMAFEQSLPIVARRSDLEKLTLLAKSLPDSRCLDSLIETVQQVGAVRIARQQEQEHAG